MQWNGESGMKYLKLILTSFVILFGANLESKAQSSCGNPHCKHCSQSRLIGHHSDGPRGLELNRALYGSYEVIRPPYDCRDIPRVTGKYDGSVHATPPGRFERHDRCNCHNCILRRNANSEYTRRDRWHAFWAEFRSDYKETNRWPEPYNYADREAVHEPFIRMVNKGWRLQTTISQDHFISGTPRLTESGKLKIRWIINHVPIEQRTIYVQRGPGPEITAARVEAITQVAETLSYDGSIPNVVVSNTEIPSWAAEYIDVIERRYLETTPEPRLGPRAPIGASGAE